MSVKPDTSSAIGILLSGESYLVSAKYLFAAINDRRLTLRFDSPLYFLVGHAFELVFKAAQKVQTGRHDFGHDLVSLWKSDGLAEFRDLVDGLERQYARNHSISEPPDFGKLLSLLNDYHGAAPYQTRYLRTGLKTLPALPFLFFVCDQLVGALKGPCNAAFVPGLQT